MNFCRHALLALGLPRLAWACSGPGAAEAIGTATLIGLLGLVLSVVLAIVGGVRRRRRGVRWVRALLGGLTVLLHPFVWLSARSGDCGQTLTAASVAVLVISLCWAVWPVKAPAPQVG
ncbi:MAG: hypothetical protein AB1938_09150 [Myxococcota bacterium]